MAYTPSYTGLCMSTKAADPLFLYILGVGVSDVE